MADRRGAAKVQKLVNRLFIRWHRFRKGKVRFKGAPSFILHTTGAKSGQPRQTPLLYLALDAGSIAVVGSNGGDDRTPAWVHNLVAHPDAEAEIDGSRRPVHARVASDAERAELWPRLVAMYASYDGYQGKTARVIPVLILEPRP